MRWRLRGTRPLGPDRVGVQEHATSRPRRRRDPCGTASAPPRPRAAATRLPAVSRRRRRHRQVWCPRRAAHPVVRVREARVRHDLQDVDARHRLVDGASRPRNLARAEVVGRRVEREEGVQERRVRAVLRKIREVLPVLDVAGDDGVSFDRRERRLAFVRRPRRGSGRRHGLRRLRRWLGVARAPISAATRAAVLRNGAVVVGRREVAGEAVAGVVRDRPVRGGRFVARSRSGPVAARFVARVARAGSVRCHDAPRPVPTDYLARGRGSAAIPSRRARFQRGTADQKQHVPAPPLSTDVGIGSAAASMGFAVGSSISSHAPHAAGHAVVASPLGQRTPVFLRTHWQSRAWLSLSRHDVESSQAAGVVGRGSSSVGSAVGSAVGGGGGGGAAGSEPSQTVQTAA